MHIYYKDYLHKYTKLQHIKSNIAESARGQHLAAVVVNGVLLYCLLASVVYRS